MMDDGIDNVVDIESRLIKKVGDLRVFQEAYALSLDMHKQTLGFPKYEQYGGIADQLRRASKSICANLAEGFIKQSHSKAEFKRFISIAIGSAGETQVWVSFCCDLGYIDGKTRDRWIDACEKNIRMLQTLRSKV